MSELIQRIGHELFVKGTKLTHSTYAGYYGMRSAIREVFYHDNELGYFLYLPINVESSVPIFDPINPTSFRWAMFNRQIIFVPKKQDEIPFKKLFKVHPDLDDYLIRFNLEFYARYNKVFVESDNVKLDQFFLLRLPVNNMLEDFRNFDKEEVKKDMYEDLLNNHVIETVKNHYYSVMPEFLPSASIQKKITSSNVDDIWKHWIAQQYGDGLIEKNDRYFSKWDNDEWIGQVVSTLVIENLTRPDAPIELDPGLKSLLGL